MSAGKLTEMMMDSIQRGAAVWAAGFSIFLGAAGVLASPVSNGLVVRLDGSAAVTSEQTVPVEVPVETWADRSGLGNDAAHGGSGTRPTVAFGVTPAGGNAVQFDGLDGQYLEIPATASLESDQLTWYFVFRPGALNQGRVINSAYEDFNPDPGVITPSYAGWGSMAAGSGRLRAQVRNAAAGFVAAEVSGVIGTNEFFIGGGRWDPLAGGGAVDVVALNEAGERFAASATGANGVPQGHLFTRIGSGAGNTNADPSSPYTGEIAEILIFTRKLSDSEQFEVEEYLYTRHFLGGDQGLTVTAGLALWLDAADLALGEPPEQTVKRVSEWTDLSGKGNHAGGGSVSHDFPQLVEGMTPTGNAAVRFNGLTEMLEIPSNPASFDGAARTWYVVFRPDNFSNTRLLNGAYADIDPGAAVEPSYAAWSGIVSGNGRYRTQGRTAGNTFLAAEVEGIVTVEDFVIGGSLWDSSTGEATAIAVDKTGRREVGTQSGIDGLPAGHEFTRIGAGAGLSNSNPTSYYAGDIAEILIYNRLLTPSEQAQVELYLREKHFGAVEELAGFAAWRDLYFEGEDATDPEVSGPLANPSGDGIANLLRYAFGLSPIGPAPREGLPQLAYLEDGGVLLTFNRLKEAGDLSFVIEVTEDLAAWHSGPELTEILDIEDLGELERVTVWGKTLPGESGRGFMRVRVELVD